MTNKSLVPFSVISFIFFAFYSWYHFQINSLAFSGLYAFVSLYSLCCLIYYKITDKGDHVKMALSLVGLPLLVPVQITGGAFGSGLYLYYIYVIWLFFLLGKRGGLLFSILIFTISVLTLFIQNAGYLPKFYQDKQLYFFYFNYALQSLLAYYYQDSKDFFERQLISKSDSLAEIAKNLQVEVQNRLLSEEANNQRTKELEDIKKAAINILEDFNEEKNNLEKSKAVDEAILTNMNDGLVYIDKSGKIIFVNHAAAHFTGVSDYHSLIGKSWFEMVKILDQDHKEIDHENRPLAKSLHSDQRISGNYFLVSSTKNIFPVYLSSSPVLIGNKNIGAIAVFRDITREYEIDKAKSEFISLASHQLRTPLSTISWYLEMLLSNDAGEVNPEQRKFLDQAYAGSKRLVSLVNALLNVSRIESNTYSVDPVPTKLQNLIRQVVDESSPKIKQKNITVDYQMDDLPEIRLDQNLTTIIFQNLVTNAVKYTREGGQIKIYLTINKEKKHVEIKVQDNGLGIPLKDQSNIFQKLFRADNAKLSSEEGTGLGLYLVKNLIEKNNGTISFESKENCGTTFIVTLPLEGMTKKEGTKKLV